MSGECDKCGEHCIECTCDIVTPKIKIDCISDLHGYFPILAGGDLLIVAGDLTEKDEEEEYDNFWRWLCYQNYKKKIVIAGNHDNFLQKNPYFFDKCGDDLVYLQDSGTEFEGLKIWGSPWTLWFHGINPKCKAFTKQSDDDLVKKWALIPHDVDILVTHMPAYGILDKTIREEKCVGSKSLQMELFTRLHPKLHVFGHIHEAYGIEPKGGLVQNSVNASIMDEIYCPWHKPVRIEL